MARQRRSLGVLRERAKRALETLTVAGPGVVVGDVLKYFYLAPGLDDDEWLEISAEDFNAPDAPPGRYRLVLFQPGGEPVAEEGEKIELGGARERGGGDPLASLHRVASSLVHTAGAEAERAAQRLRAEEERHDVTRESARLYEARTRELEARVAELEAELEAGGGDSVDRFGAAILDLFYRFVGGQVGARTQAEVDALNAVLTAIRREPNVQKAIEAAGSGAPLKLLLGDGDKNGV